MKPKKHLSIQELSIFCNAEVMVSFGEKSNKGYIKGFDYEGMQVRIEFEDTSEYWYHPSRIKPLLIDVDSVHEHIQKESNIISEAFGDHDAMLYLIKKNVDVFGWIEKGYAIKKFANKKK